MIRYGAGGYLMKTSSIDDLTEGIITIARKGSNINEYISGRLITNIRNSIKIEGDEVMNLTARKRQNIFYCCSEIQYKEIDLRMKFH